MNWKLTLSAGLIWALLALTPNVMASELQDYVLRCQNELGFQANQVPELDCNDGVRFDNPAQTPINDFFAYHRVNDKVDLTVACRWGNDFSTEGPFENVSFVSLEMIIHNRENGGTCFFGAKDGTAAGSEFRVANPIVSPTNFPAADDYWLQPTEVNTRQLPTNVSLGDPGELTTLRCVDCHSQGPYIASKNIAPFLAQYGLMNDGHDITVDISNPFATHYYAVGSNEWNNPNGGSHAFKAWNSIIYNNLYVDDSTSPPTVYGPGDNCSDACHQVATFSDQGSIFPATDSVTEFQSRFIVLPSIGFDISELAYQLDGMPPVLPYADDDSPYHWMNLDTPWNGIERETFEHAKLSSPLPATPLILSDCNFPGNTEAHAVGLDEEYSFSSLEIGWLPNRLNTFNLKEGLLCLTSEQTSGNSCRNYETSYLCAEDNGAPKTWTPWFNGDSPTGDGVDNELRSLSAVSATCENPVAIKARFFTAGIPVEVIGPNDRLAQFSKYRLACNNLDQVDGQCSNYVVRYRDCQATNEEQYVAMTNAWSYRRLTASNGSNSAQVRGQPDTSSWNTQHWMLEPEANSPYVRIRNVGTNTYLNVRGQEEYSIVETYEIRDWDSQRWIVEPVSGSIDYRLKNVWSGRYLTMGDNGNYSAVYSQYLRTGWTSQRWLFAFD